MDDQQIQNQAAEGTGETQGVEFENGVGWDNGELVVQPDAAEDAIETIAEEPVAPVQPQANPELELIRQQVSQYQKEIQYKDQVLALAKAELEKHLKTTEELPENFDFLETFADKQKGIGFLQGFVNKIVEQKVSQAYGQIPQIVGGLLMQQSVNNFKQNNSEAFGPDGFLLPEIYQKLEPVLQKYPNMTLEDAYKPYKELYKQRSQANKQVNQLKAQKLMNTRNMGSTAANPNPAKPEGKMTLEQAWKAAEQELLNRK